MEHERPRRFVETQDQGGVYERALLGHDGLSAREILEPDEMTLGLP